MEERDVAAVARIREGDTEAFRELVERHSRSIFRLSYRLTGNEQDAEDTVQETFIRAYRRLDHFEQWATFKTWLYRIAINCAHFGSLNPLDKCGSGDIHRRRRRGIDRCPYATSECR